MPDQETNTTQTATQNQGQQPVIVNAPSDVSWYQKTLDTFLGFVTGGDDDTVDSDADDSAIDADIDGGVLAQIEALKAEIAQLKGQAPTPQAETGETPSNPKLETGPDIATAPDSGGVETELEQFRKLYQENPRQASAFYQANSAAIAKQLAQAMFSN